MAPPTLPRETGYYHRTTVAGEEVAAFEPFPLPPRDPPLNLGGELSRLLTRAEIALRHLDLASAMVPSGRKRDQQFGYTAYLERLRQGTETQ